MSKRARKSSGAVRMQELGKRPIQLWATMEELAAIRTAAAADRRPVSQWVLLQALQAAELQTHREQQTTRADAE